MLSRCATTSPHTRPEPADEHGGVAPPRRPTISPPRPVRARGRRLAGAAAGQRRRDDRRPAAPAVAARPAPAGDRPGPNDFQVNKTAPAAGITAGDDRPRLPARAARGGRERAALSRDELLAMAAAHRAAADRVRRGLDDHAGVDRRAARRPRAARPAPPAPRRALVRSLQPRGVLARASLNAGQVARPGRAAGAEGQRRRPLARPRLPGADHRPRRCRACTTRSGSARSSSHEGPLRRLPAAPARAPRRCCRWSRGRCCRSSSAATRRGSSSGSRSARVAARPRAAAVLRRARPRRAARAPGRAVNYVRVPALISGLLLLVFFPAISRQGRGRLPRRQRRSTTTATSRAGC